MTRVIPLFRYSLVPPFTNSLVADRPQSHMLFNSFLSRQTRKLVLLMFRTLFNPDIHLPLTRTLIYNLEDFHGLYHIARAVFCVLLMLSPYWNMQLQCGLLTLSKLESIQRCVARFVIYDYHQTCSVSNMLLHLNWNTIEMPKTAQNCLQSCGCLITLF